MFAAEKNYWSDKVPTISFVIMTNKLQSFRFRNLVVFLQSGIIWLYSYSQEESGCILTVRENLVVFLQSGRTWLYSYSQGESSCILTVRENLVVFLHLQLEWIWLHSYTYSQGESCCILTARENLVVFLQLGRIWLFSYSQGESDSIRVSYSHGEQFPILQGGVTRCTLYMYSLHIQCTLYCVMLLCM